MSPRARETNGPLCRSERLLGMKSCTCDRLHDSVRTESTEDSKEGYVHSIEMIKQENKRHI